MTSLIIGYPLELVDSFYNSIDREEILLEELLKLRPCENGKSICSKLLAEEAFRLLNVKFTNGGLSFSLFYSHFHFIFDLFPYFSIFRI